MSRILTCPYCGKQSSSIGGHIYKCPKRPIEKTDAEIKHDLIIYNYGDTIYDEVSKDYLNNYSLPMLKDKYGIAFKTINAILSEMNISIRSISESFDKIVREKNIKTSLERYGVTNPSQSDIVKEKKRNTFLKHYGVDNIWKTKEYAKFTSNRWKNYTAEEKNNILKKWTRMRGQVSLLEQRVTNMLLTLQIPFVSQFKFSNYYHKYDIKLSNTKILIEVNGDFWHANPNIYKENDVLNFPRKQVIAKDLWNLDSAHIAEANKRGYIVLTIWEHDICSCTDDELSVLLIDIINSVNN